MIYLDYAAHTPVHSEVLDCLIATESHYPANPNSAHPMGKDASAALLAVKESMASMLSVSPDELIFTSGASEANNLAIKGIAASYKEQGRHIISTCLEHPSVSGALTHLQSIGYEIDLVDIAESGQIDLLHLRELLRSDTILVSICAVDGELGVKQPIGEIKELLTEFPNCHLHTDATQAVGKTPFDCSLADCVTIASHKFYGLCGFGVLVKKKGTVLSPLMHGGAGDSVYRSGTPCLGLASSCAKALDLSLQTLPETARRITEYNLFLRESLARYPLLRINSTAASLPHFLNISVKGVKGETFRDALGEVGVCVSVKSACSVAGTPSRAVFAVTKDKKNALCSFRISLGTPTTKEELQEFLNLFDQCYTKLTTF